MKNLTASFKLFPNRATFSKNQSLNLQKKSDLSNSGFSLIELMMVMMLISIVSTFAVINLTRPQTRASLDTTVSSIAAEIKQQQLKAMVGFAGSDNTTSFASGIIFQTGPQRYTLFKGTTFDVGNTDNFTVNLEDKLTVSTTFASSQIIFSRLSGEIQNFVNGQNTVTVTNTASNEQKVITVNRYGAITVN